jgi:hypothetical protein
MTLLLEELLEIRKAVVEIELISLTAKYNYYSQKFIYSNTDTNAIVVIERDSLREQIKYLENELENIKKRYR